MKRKYYIILSLSYAILILILSSIPKPPFIEKPGIDIILHMIEYSILGFFTLGSFRNRNSEKIVVLVIIICSIYGILNEIYQYYIPGRYSSGLDMIANSVGSILGVMISQRYSKKFKNRELV